jgi:hypothetical protein
MGRALVSTVSLACWVLGISCGCLLGAASAARRRLQDRLRAGAGGSGCSCADLSHRGAAPAGGSMSTRSGGTQELRQEAIPAGYACQEITASVHLYAWLMRPENTAPC